MRRKGYAKRAAAILMAVMMALNVSGCGSSKETSKVEQQEALAEKEEDGDGLKEILEGSFGLGDKLERNVGKEEKVYVIADAKGNPDEVIVSEWLKNPDHLDTLEDESGLSDIENVKGDEAFTQDGEKVTWQANGNDIYYQGTTSEELPVAVHVTYLLDGHEIEPDELAGKSGLVTVRYTYENKTKGEVKTPFLMVTGLIVDENTFSDVSVTNGKLISDGSRYIIVGIGLPGLEESLGMDEGIVPESFEFTARTTGFELPMALTFAECDFLMGERELSLEEIEGKLNDLTGQYQDGMKALNDGLKKYVNGVDQVADSVKKIDDGARQLNDGANQLNVGIRAAENGAEQLTDGLESAKAGSDQLAAGANELNEAVQGVNLPDMASQDQTLTPEQQSAAAKQIQAKAEEQLGQSTADYVMASVDQSDLADLAALSGMTPEEQKAEITKRASAALSQDANYAAVRSAVVEAMVDSTKQNLIDAAVTATVSAMKQQGVASAVAVKKEEVFNAAAVVYANAGEAGLSQFVEAVRTGGGSLDQYLAAYYSNAAALAGAREAAIAAAGDDIVDAIASQVSATVDAQVEANMEAIKAACAESINNREDEIRAGVEASVDQMLTPAYVSGYGSATQEVGADVQAFSGKLQQNLPAAIQGVASSYGTAGVKVGADFVMQAVQVQLDGFATQLAALKNGTSRLAAGTTELSTGLGALSQGAGQLESGMAQLDEGSTALYQGSSTLASGTKQLANGADQLKTAGPQLTSGSDKLTEATATIMKKLTETEDKADALVKKINLLREAANNYQSYGGKSDKTEGSVKFFIKTEGVTTD